MIKLYARLPPVVVRGLRGDVHDPFEVLKTRFRVLPHDIDLNLHLNNGRYLQLMDLSRVEWMLRTRIFQSLLKNGWRGILGGTAVHYRNEMKLWERGVVTTRLQGWDDRWFYLEHCVDGLDGRPIAIGVVKVGIRGNRQWVRPETVEASLSYSVEHPVQSDQFSTFNSLDLMLSDEMRRRSQP